VSYYTSTIVAGSALLLIKLASPVCISKATSLPKDLAEIDGGLRTLHCRRGCTDRLVQAFWGKPSSCRQHFSSWSDLSTHKVFRHCWSNRFSLTASSCSTLANIAKAGPCMGLALKCHDVPTKDHLPHSRTVTTLNRRTGALPGR